MKRLNLGILKSMPVDKALKNYTSIRPEDSWHGIRTTANCTSSQ